MLLKFSIIKQKSHYITTRTIAIKHRKISYPPQYFGPKISFITSRYYVSKAMWEYKDCYKHIDPNGSKQNAHT